ncbi:MAG: hypothetical protein MK212_12555 [Saprospiraceae bacterium]|nr:hypothetical protein [Saprospiraceae bacterium]
MKKNYGQLLVKFTRQQLDLIKKQRELQLKQNKKTVGELIFWVLFIAGSLIIGILSAALNTGGYLFVGWSLFLAVYFFIAQKKESNQAQKLKQEYKQYFLNLFVTDFLAWKYPKIKWKSEQDYTKHYYEKLGLYIPWKSYIVSHKLYQFFEMDRCQYCSFNLELDHSVYKNLHIDAYIVDWPSQTKGLTLISYPPKLLSVSKEELETISMDFKEFNTDLYREDALVLSTNIPHAYEIINPNFNGFLDLFTPEERSMLTIMWLANKMTILVAHSSETSPLDLPLEQDFINIEDYHQFDRSLELGEYINNFIDQLKEDIT